MQLFHTDQFEISGGTMMIYDQRVIYQLKRVMRARPWQQIALQYQQHSQTVRYICQIVSFDDSLLQVLVTDMISYDHPSITKQLVVAMSNKWDKMELIVQKATECGVSSIIVVPMRRSVINHYNANKWKRIETISLEAVEQSWSFQLPVLQWCDRLKDLQLWWKILIADMGWELLSWISVSSDITVVIGPEWWLDSQDIATLNQLWWDITTISLWSGVLRMETAAIVSARWINQ